MKDMKLRIGNGATRLGVLLAGVILVTTCSASLTGVSGPVSKNVDLAPAGLASTWASVPDGGTLAISLTLDNLQPGAQAFPFSVDFFLSMTGTFAPGTDTKVGTVVVPSGPAGDSGLVVAGSVSIPAGSLNQAVYIYAVVDPAGTITETNTANNISSIGNARIVNIYDNTLPILLETYAPSGSGADSTIISLYKNVAGVAVYQGVESNAGGPGGYATVNAGLLGPGTYYVAVVSWDSGPYAFAVRTSGFSRITFANLTSNLQDPYEPDDSPKIWPVTQDLGPTATPFGQNQPLPTAPLTVPVGGMVNRYSGPGDWDWFTFTLP